MNVCILLLIPTLLVGCNRGVDKEELKKNIELSNRRIETVVDDYNTSKIKAKIFYESSVKYISGETQNLIVDDMDSYYIDEFTAVLNDFKDVITTLYEDEKLFREESGLGSVSYRDFIKDMVESHYFLNDTKGLLEQDIVFKLPYGKVLGLEIDWLVGKIYGFETYTNN